MMTMQPSPRGPLEPRLPASEHRRSASNVSIHGPKEPKDGTRAQPGPSSAKIAGKPSTEP